MLDGAARDDRPEYPGEYFPGPHTFLVNGLGAISPLCPFSRSISGRCRGRERLGRLRPARSAPPSGSRRHLSCPIPGRPRLPACTTTFGLGPVPASWRHPRTSDSRRCPSSSTLIRISPSPASSIAVRAVEENSSIRVRLGVLPMPPLDGSRSSPVVMDGNGCRGGSFRRGTSACSLGVSGRTGWPWIRRSTRPRIRGEGTWIGNPGGW